MRTCKQLHSEMAVLLYSSPFELANFSNSHFLIPFPHSYAHLVQRVAIIHGNVYSGIDRHLKKGSWEYVPWTLLDPRRIFTGLWRLRLVYDHGPWKLYDAQSHMFGILPEEYWSDEEERTVARTESMIIDTMKQLDGSLKISILEVQESVTYAKDGSGVYWIHWLEVKVDSNMINENKES